MNANLTTRSALAASALAAAIVGGLLAAPASAQMFNEPFSFTDRSPEAMAIYMRNRDDRNANSGVVAAGGGNGGETLVCAGTGENTATSAGNIMCVLAGSGANVIVGSEQDSGGDQTSDAETNKTTGDEISDILYGDDNGAQ